MSSNGSVTVQLVDSEKRKRSTVEVINDVKKEFSELAGANITYEAGNSTAGSAIGGADMQIGIESDDAEIVRDTLIDIKSYIKENAKYVDNIKTEVDSGTPEIVMKLNKSAAIQYGVNTSLLSNTLSNSLSGMDSTRVTINGENITLKLKMNDEYGNSIENMKSIIINTPAGKQVPVGQVAEISYDNGPATIMKENQKVQSSVDITFNENIDIKKGTSEIDTLMNNYIMPSGVSLNTGGTTSEIDETFKNLTMALFLSILLVYIVLASQFESFILPVMIMMSIPFAFSGSFLALFLTGEIALLSRCTTSRSGGE